MRSLANCILAKEKKKKSNVLFSCMIVQQLLEHSSYGSRRWRSGYITVNVLN